MEDNEETIKVKCVLDGFETTLIKKAAERSVLLKDLLINYQADKIFEVQNVNKEAMEKVKEYLEHYKDVEPKEIKKPLKGSKFSECVEEWDNTFIGNEDNIEKLENYILAASFLNIKPLIELLSLKIAFMIKGINTPTIRNIFGIKKLNGEERKQFQEDEKIIEDKKY